MALPTILGSVAPAQLLVLLVLMLIASTAKCVPTVDLARGQPEVIDSADDDGGQGSHLEKRSRDNQPVQLCGFRLLEAVRGLCRGNYVGYNRRSDPEMRNGDRMMTMMMMVKDAENEPAENTKYELTAPNNADQEQQPVLDVILMKMAGEEEVPSSSSSATKGLHRYRRNIIDECCKKPCSINEMLRYCGRD